MCHKLKTILYHGTASEIRQVDVALGRERKDFGKGFYMAVSKEQAIGMMHKKYREVVRRSRGKQDEAFSEKLYEITLDGSCFSKLKIKMFSTADSEWLDFVLMCRERGGMPHDYDMVVGPTADDDTAFCLKAYWDGFYGKVGSENAKKILLDNLETENLGVQYFIGKQGAADQLIKDIQAIAWR
ncbi:MAG: DUF3990 domain-containing protein [Clostridium sp.]|nr:DUF3990 domain-containing protein [Clostridium sp.]